VGEVRRALDELRDLRRLAEPHTHLPVIADLSHRICVTITARLIRPVVRWQWPGCRVR
jgi:hypothetical protein